MRHIRKLLAAVFLMTGSVALAQSMTARSAADCPAVADAIASSWLDKMVADANQRYNNPTARSQAIAQLRRDAAERRRARLSECLSAFSRGRTTPWTSH